MVVPDSPENHGDVTLQKTISTSSSLTRISESPIKENLAPSPTTLHNNSLRHVNSRWSFSSSVRSFGSSKDEIFYESCPWLPSDSEDDFYSVNGDFTPSRGNTPKCSFSDRPPRFSNPLIEGERPRVSFSHPPAPRRKKLDELFRESIREEREEKFEESSKNQSDNFLERPRVSFSHPPTPRRKKLGELFRESTREDREEKFEESSKNQSGMSKKSSSDNFGELEIIKDSTKDKENLKSLNYRHRCLPRFSSFKNGIMEKRKKKKKKIHVRNEI